MNKVKLIKVKYSDDHDYHLVRQWVQDNCRDKYYSGVDWDVTTWQVGGMNRMYQFENERDAAWFTLRWA